MKKKLLFASLFLSAAFSMNAQTVVFSDNFDDEDISDWTVFDADGDGFDWIAVQITDEDGAPVDTPMLRSASWSSAPAPFGTALTPNNYIISPAINLSAYPAGSTVILRWEVKASDADYDAEKYAAYAATSDEPADLMASNYQFNEASLDGVNELEERTLDISGLAGQANVYVAFRHYGVTNEFTMEVDNVSVTATLPLKTADFFASNFSVYPNPSADVINLTSSTSAAINNVELTDINGRVVKTVALAGVAQTQLNISDLTSGVYFLSVESDLGKGVTKIVRK